MTSKTNHIEDGLSKVLEHSFSFPLKHFNSLPEKVSFYLTLMSLQTVNKFLSKGIDFNKVIKTIDKKEVVKELFEKSNKKYILPLLEKGFIRIEDLRVHITYSDGYYDYDDTMAHKKSTMFLEVLNALIEKTKKTADASAEGIKNDIRTYFSTIHPSRWIDIHRSNKPLLKNMVALGLLVINDPLIHSLSVGGILTAVRMGFLNINQMIDGKSLFMLLAEKSFINELDGDMINQLVTYKLNTTKALRDMLLDLGSRDDIDHSDLIKALLVANASPNYMTNGETILGFVVNTFIHDTKYLELLIQHGADLSFIDPKNGQSLLHALVYNLETFEKNYLVNESGDRYNYDGYYEAFDVDNSDYIEEELKRRLRLIKLILQNNRALLETEDADHKKPRDYLTFVKKATNESSGSHTSHTEQSSHTEYEEEYDEDQLFGLKYYRKIQSLLRKRRQ